MRKARSRDPLLGIADTSAAPRVQARVLDRSWNMQTPSGEHDGLAPSPGRANDHAAPDAQARARRTPRPGRRGGADLPRGPSHRRIPRRRRVLRPLRLPDHVVAPGRGPRPRAIGLRAFWARRARRLLPALACVLVGVAAVRACGSPSPTSSATIRGDALATIGYFANWRAIFTSRDYWSHFRAPSPLDHTWSLAIEEQFYLVWPLVVAALVARVQRPRRGPQAVGRVGRDRVGVVGVDAPHLRPGRSVACLLRHRHAARLDPHRRRARGVARAPRPGP